MKSTTDSNLVAWQVALLVVIIASAGGGYWGYQKYLVLESELDSSEQKNTELTTQLEKSVKDYADISEESRYKQSIIDKFQGQIENIGQTVGTLDKLSKIDKELLKKYSKVYFLNENYVPAKLTPIEKKYAFSQGGSNFLIHGDVWSYLEDLLKDARSDGIELLVASAFRSFDIQSSLKNEYTVIYGAGTANQFSADQGYSEHQLGTAVDFTTPAVAGVSAKFRTDPGFEWLRENAYKYGFILSYPEGNAYYKFEPWHWRFVGVDLAQTLHRSGKNFYDLDQREIDEYLIKLFD